MTVATPHIKTKEVYYPTSDGKPMAETDLHLHQMFYVINGLDAHYLNDPDVYVAGNNFLYYEQGNPRAVVSPDCYVVFGVPKRERDTYKVWEENGNTPDVVFEITSKKTKDEDINSKRFKYEHILKVSEYFMFDPTGDYLNPHLQGYRLVEGHYVNIPLVDGRMCSEQIGLELVQEGNTLRLYDPVRGAILLTPREAMQRAESEARRAESEARRAESEARRANSEAQKAVQSAQRADQQTQRADTIEAENERLRAEIAAMREGRQAF